MIELFTGFIEEHAFTGLFIASFLASTIFPLGSEAFVILLISKGFDPLSIIMVASIGNYLGACTTYYIGIRGRTDVIERYFSISKEQLERTDRLFSKYGAFLLIFTWLPLIGDAIAATGGVLKLDFKIFSFYVFIGKLARYVTITYITMSTMVFF
ncbi:YqaA family protein [Methanolobus profundi]|uniref:Membrane protein YqaA, SNARE-associated domain n=1 Tax=Methanolobus profundi TaxID=487685 RepID=A0A1I4TK19_9EURY|nr:YqaA family protein [Methanolobus profundi]SFM76917.1 membrane protein YqaA, SNARE-associated domain [Methanolobus profundi]